MWQMDKKLKFSEPYRDIRFKTNQGEIEVRIDTGYHYMRFDLKPDHVKRLRDFLDRWLANNTNEV